MGLLPVPEEGPWVEQEREEQEGAPRLQPVGEKVWLGEGLWSTVEVEVEVRRALLQQRPPPLPGEGPQGWVGAPRLCPLWEVLAERVKQQRLRAE